MVFLFASIAMAQPNLLLCLSDADAVGWHPSQKENEGVQERSVKVIPVVVHVIYEHDFLDIPDNEIQSIIDAVNQDFRRLNADTVDTPDAFKSVAADTKIEFALASLDAGGMPTTGITHKKGTFNWSGNLFSTNVMKFDTLGGTSAWDTKHYLNIWILGTENLGGISGVALFPPAHGSEIDGITIGNGLSGQFIKLRLTHNLGHYLGLMHIYGNGLSCSTQIGGFDGLTDTPNQFQSSALTLPDDCLSFPTTDTCSSQFPGIMFMNYMDDSQPDCSNLFTQQQADVMNYVVDSVRYSLLQPSISSIHFIEKAGCFKIWPNPANRYLTVNFDGTLNGAREYRFFDELGRLVLKIETEEAISKQDVLDVSKLPSGSYWFMIDTGSTKYRGRVVKL